MQADESTGGGPRSAYEIAKERAAHVLHFKIHRYGGLLPSARMAAIAEAAGLEISVAPYFDIIAAAAANFAAATPVAKWPAGFSDMTDTILAEPYEPDGQVLPPPLGPVWGLRLMRTSSLSMPLYSDHVGESSQVRYIKGGGYCLLVCMLVLLISIRICIRRRSP